MNYIFIYLYVYMLLLQIEQKETNTFHNTNRKRISKLNRIVNLFIYSFNICYCNILYELYCIIRI